MEIILSSSSPNEVSLEQADALFERGNWTKAIETYQKLISKNTEQPLIVFEKLAYAFAMSEEKFPQKAVLIQRWKSNRIEELMQTYVRTFLTNVSNLTKSASAISGEIPFRCLKTIAPRVPQKFLKDCKLVNSREQMLHYLPKGKIVVEVGTLQGHFAKKILDITNPKVLHIIDHEMFRLDYPLFDHHIKEGRVILHEGDSTATLNTFEEGFFDWVYVDADNTYAAAISDLEAGYRKVKEGGLLICNGYNAWSPKEIKTFGYRKAVNEIILKYELQCLYLTLDEYGYHDIVLKK